MSNQECYLGDGVYASFDGYHIILDLRAQPIAVDDHEMGSMRYSHICKIAIEPSVWNALVQFRQRLISSTEES